MTDRELLEKAAKAAELLTHTDRSGVWIVEEDMSPVRRWNPLTDDGDALRLFCTLPWMAIETSDVGVTVRERGSPDEPSRVLLMWTEWLDKHSGNVTAATRRAIVRAAAEMGDA